MIKQFNTNMPKSVRNNNPGNIRNSESNRWIGEVPSTLRKDKEFEVFTTMEYGARAMIKLLRNYMHGKVFDKVKYNTLETIIFRWAPPHENDTAAYVREVQSLTGWKAGEKLEDDRETLITLAWAMAQVEGAKHPSLTKDVFERGYALL